jgi:hypothetical protein
MRAHFAVGASHFIVVPPFHAASLRG